MDHIHKRFTAEQVGALLKGYCQGTLDRAAVEQILEVNKTRFFALLKEYRRNPENFSLSYQRETSTRLPASVDEKIEKQLMLEKGLVEDPTLPIRSYNYSAVRNRLLKEGVKVSLPTIIERAKRLDCYKRRPKKQAHDREVGTTAIGALIQHDASLHRWFPYAQEKWTLITSIDDFSRKLLFADFVKKETSWAHIQAAEALMKGKIERPYRWLQDRIVRTCAIERVTTMDEARPVLKEELDRYNNHQVHSVTGEVPSIRFANAGKEGNSLFKPFALPKPYGSAKDIFCLRDTRRVNGYRRISLFNHEIEVPKVPLREIL